MPKKEEKKNKYKRKVHVVLTGAAAGTQGWHILDIHPPFFDEEVNDKSVKAKESMCECVF